jgi:hypothetical protein
MTILYGQQRKNWQTALQRVKRTSTIFSNNFTRQRGSEPVNAGIARSGIPKTIND